MESWGEAEHICTPAGCHTDAEPQELRKKSPGQREQETGSRDGCTEIILGMLSQSDKGPLAQLPLEKRRLLPGLAVLSPSLWGG